MDRREYTSFTFRCSRSCASYDVALADLVQVSVCVSAVAQPILTTACQVPPRRALPLADLTLHFVLPQDTCLQYLQGLHWLAVPVSV